MSFPNYLDCVPLKINPKLESPPHVDVPEAICNRFSAPEYDLVERLSYDFTLERCVISKIDEWQQVREQERKSRLVRIGTKELEKARAREEKQKQMLTDVSYPSADDLSSSDDSEVECKRKKGAVGCEPNEEVENTLRSNLKFDTILTPTVVSNQTSTSSSTWSTPLLTYQSTNKLTNHSDINYSDFEDVESSPFDIVELKTINDLDILAQVLNETQIHSEGSLTERKDNENVVELSVGDTLNDVQNVSSNGTFSDTPSAFSYHVAPSNSDRNTITTHSNEENQKDLRKYENMKGKLFQNLLYNSQQYLQQHPPLQLQNSFNVSTTFSTSVPKESADITFSSRSKSVPDILKELNSEVRDSKERRTRNHSKTTIKNLNDVLIDEDVSQPIKVRHEKCENPDNFMKLSPTSQKLVKDISVMGFPLERVSKITQIVGKDDKRIIEHLIALNELLDLGFEESKISEALVKFNNNKEKALDFLIS